MNEALLDAFRHNSWATGHLLAACRGLSEEQLATSSAAAFGSILLTFNHLVRSDAGYARRLAGGGPGDGPAWVDGDEVVGLDQLEARVEETGQLWERILSEPIDPERVIVVDKGASAVRAGIFVAQALHHGSAHREQVCAILTGLGIQPPDVQAWEYAWATGRLWERTGT